MSWSLVHVLSSLILTVKGEVLLYPCNETGTETLSSLPEITQLVSGKAGIVGIAYIVRNRAK